MERDLPVIRFEANEWRVTRGGSLLFRASSQKHAQAWLAAHYLPLATAKHRRQSTASEA
jgi:hypothetical protein